MIDCLCGNHMSKVGVFANVKSKTLISYLCFTCGASTVQCEQAKRIAVQQCARPVLVRRLF